MQENRQSGDDLVALAADYRRYLASVVMFHLAAADAVGLGANDYQASSILDLDGPMTAGQLASRLGLSTGATTRLIDRMERSGYLRRTRDATDRRRVLVQHTQDRPEQLDDILGKVTEPVAAVLRALTPEQLEGVAKYVRGAKDAYTEATAQINH
ncbi:MarR family transcriptional regulator [uncultured Microbacterium sp.]|uniref:MarR family winged helix-turn-helix transcriptional regulator n=1 Tax=uncultured Microbacterium sp. TaxID=191216 RepID=UPI0028D091E0|nr:MarR family transcriptional regulator [uncultured Microbacterium sp.]